MRFFNITSKYNTATNNLLAKSCKERKLEYINIDSEDLNAMYKADINKNDLLYKTATNEKARTIEEYLRTKDPVTFYKTPAIYEKKELPMYLKYKLSIPKMFLGLTRDRKILKEQVDALGRFPIIIKISGGSHGIGVMKIDSFSSLISVIDFLVYNGFESKGVLKQFINVRTCARLIVLGNKVIDSIEYRSQDYDFRTNATKKMIIHPQKYSKEVESTAIKAVNCLELEFGGVDILIDDQDKHYLLETNFPCFFPRCQRLTKTDISGMMIDHLIEKSKK